MKVNKQRVYLAILFSIFCISTAYAEDKYALCDRLLRKAATGSVTVVEPLPKWLGKRSSGVLLSVTSLPSKHGIGEIGPEAIRWIDQLHDSKQKFWQILPLGPTGYGDSPYQALSSFAGNHTLISLEGLEKIGLLTSQDIANPPPFNENRIDYGKAINYRTPLLNLAVKNFEQSASTQLKKEFQKFVEKEKYWLEDYSLYMALKQKYQKSWTDWPAELVKREPTALEQAKKDFKEDIQKHKVLQFLFEKQWAAVRDHAKKKGVKIIGDLPIYVAHDSADTWANQSLFLLDAEGKPTKVAGVPPDGFSADGQLWGNPIYKWDENKKQKYAWWISRINRSREMADVVRFDHFRAFESYWEIPAGSSAKQGQWIKGPGTDLFDSAAKKLGKLPVIAEDLGVITPEVDGLRKQLGFPGMAITQFGFGSSDPGAMRHRPFDVPSTNTIIYTGTHDNETLVEHFSGTSEWIRQEIDEAKKYTGTDDSTPINEVLIAATMSSPAGLTITPAQDLLGLGVEGRQNRPGSSDGNWNWQMGSKQMTKKILTDLKDLTTQSGRD